jgi:ABC-2 type transport system permease protein
MTTGELQLLVYFANLGAICTILSSFTSRFLFPMLSLEGRAFWIIGLAPIPRSRIVQEKALFGLAVTVILGMATTIVSNAALHVPPSLFLGAVLTVLLAGVCLTSLATGLGAAYPVFEEDNPARIAVGMGGALNFFASALAVAVLILLQAMPYLAFGTDPGHWTVASHAAAIVFTVVLGRFCYRLGTRSIERREF